MMWCKLAGSGNESTDEILKFTEWKNVWNKAVSVHGSIVDPRCSFHFHYYCEKCSQEDLRLLPTNEGTVGVTCVIIGKYSECFLNVVLINICIKTVAAEDSLCWLRDFRPAVALISPVGQWQDYNPRKKIIHAYSVLIYSLCCCFINIKLNEVFHSFNHSSRNYNIASSKLNYLNNFWIFC